MRFRVPVKPDPRPAHDLPPDFVPAEVGPNWSALPLPAIILDARGRVAAIRGVNVDGVIRTLLARGLVEEAGHDVDTGAAVLATTREFLEKMGLAGLDDLPPIAPHLPEVEELEAELASGAQSGGFTLPVIPS